jgi:hypothetical protein
MKAVYYLADEPLGAEIRLTAQGLVPVGSWRWLQSWPSRGNG